MDNIVLEGNISNPRPYLWARGEAKGLIIWGEFLQLKKRLKIDFWKNTPAFLNFFTGFCFLQKQFLDWWNWFIIDEIDS